MCCLRQRWRTRSTKAAALLAIVLLAACTTTSSAPTATAPARRSSTTTSNPVAYSGPAFTVYWAEAPDASPDWIFPLADLTHFSIANIEQFQYLMYRPLYSFDDPTATAVPANSALSLAGAPEFNADRTAVTIQLKAWRFADGQPIDAQSVAFWMNMMKAEAPNWGDYLAGAAYFPDDVVSYSTTAATSATITFDLSRPVNESWYLDNELSQITPMAEAWDITSLHGRPGSGGCGAVASGPMTGAATAAACRAVWRFDTDNDGRTSRPEMAGDPATYATNRLWSEGADGPWKLVTFNAATGRCSFRPNTSYGGPDKPFASEFVELPFSSDTAEYRALVRGGATAPTVGYLPFEYTPQLHGDGGPNASALASRYRLVAVPPWQINYETENFNSTGDGGNAGAIFSQLYVRRALQELVDQPAIIRRYLKGYGIVSTGPAPSLAGVSPNPYAFEPAAAEALLRVHGWNIKPGGVDTCERAGTADDECGRGIPNGAQLRFFEQISAGDATLTETALDEQASWSRAGIEVSLSDFASADESRCAKGPSCAWELSDPGAGWLFAPNDLPTGEYLWLSSSPFDLGSYHDDRNDALIVSTLSSAADSGLGAWEDYLSRQLPVIWQPVPEIVAEVASKLHGVTMDAFGDLTPEYWYFSS